MKHHRLWIVWAGLLVLVALAGEVTPFARGQQKDPPKPLPAPAVEVKPARMGGAMKAPALPQDENPEFTDRVKLPIDRQAERKVVYARRLVKEEEWAEAVRLLQSILDSKEDVFLKDERGRWVSVRAEANRILLAMPREGRQFYEVQYGGQAQADLKKGRQANDPQVFADVALRYLYTEAGAQATALLATYHLDQGRYVVAALCYERLLEREGFLDKMTPVELFKAALAFERAADEKNRDLVWTALSKKLNGEPMKLGQQKLELAKLRALMARATDAATHGRFDWPMFLGAPDRTAQRQGDAPFLVHRYKLDTAKEKQTEFMIQQAMRARLQKLNPVLAGFHPIAAGDKLVFRSYWGLHAVNVKTGRNLDASYEVEWEARSRVGLDVFHGRDQTAIDSTAQMRGWINNYLQYHPSILYDNSLIGTLATDHQRVYWVDDLAVPPHPNFAMQRQWNNAGLNLGPQLTRWLYHNKLVAHDLVTGKLLWEIGTSEANDDFANMFFLGPPLPLGEKLYALVEANQEIRLLCLDARVLDKLAEAHNPVFKNAIVWSQTLCLVEKRLLDEAVRRTQAAALAYGDGVLVCPTNAGVILGVDLLTRSLVWAQSYQETKEGDAPPVAPFPQGRGRGGIYQNLSINLSSWAPSAPIIRDGKVVFTAPDGQSVHCLNLRDGSLLWKEPQANDLYLAGVYLGKVLLVGKETCRALNLKDGSSAWKTETGMPSGRGVANETSYFLPLQKGEVWTIDLQKGRVLAKSPSPKGETPGNLIIHDGDVLSQTALAVAAYPQLAVKEREITARLQKDARDPRGLADRGELRLHRGDHAGAVADLHTALAADPPADVRAKARSKLYEALGELLDQNFALHELHLKEFEELTLLPVPAGETEEVKNKRLEDQRHRRANFLRLVAKGREAQGRIKESFQAYMEFAALGGKELITLPDEPSTRVRPDVWAKSRVAELLARAKPDHKQALHQAIEESWKQAQATAQGGDLEPLRRFVDLFGSICEPGRQAQLHLADKLIAAENFTEAELQLVDVWRHAEPPLAAKAVDALARLMTRQGLLEDAGFYYRVLHRQFAKVVIRDGKTGDDLYQEAATDKRLLPYLEESKQSWNGGSHQFLVDVRAHGNFPYVHVTALEPEGDVLPFFQRHRLVVNQSFRQAKLIDKVTGEEKRVFSLQGGVSPVNTGIRTGWTYRTAGHVLVFTWGHYVYGFDAVQHKELWKFNLLGSYDPVANAQQGVAVQVIPAANGGLELLHGDGFREPIGTLGTVSAEVVTFFVKDEGLVAIDPLSGRTLWTRADLPGGTRAFGDHQHIYLLLPSRDGGVGRSLTLRALDGLPVQTPDFAGLHARRLQVHGRKLLVRDLDVGDTVLRLCDVHTGKDVWSRNFGQQALTLTSLDPDLTGAIDANGKGAILRSATGEEVLRFSVDRADVNPAQAGQNQVQREVSFLLDGGSVYLIFNAAFDPNQPQANRRTAYNQTQLRGLMVNGPIYALDRYSGQVRWKKEVPYQVLLADQFDESPLLVFASVQTQWVQLNPQAANQAPFARAVAAVLVLDKRDGKEVFKDEPSQRAQFHTLQVDLRAGEVKLIGAQYMARFVLTYEGARTDGAGER